MLDLLLDLPSSGSIEKLRPAWLISAAASSLMYSSIAVYPDGITLVWSLAFDELRPCARSRASAMPSRSASAGAVPGLSPSIRLLT